MIFNFFKKNKAVQRIIGSSDAISQILILEPEVINYVNKHKQLKANATEAGGQLFGTVEEDEIRVVKATGPYHNDQRGRYFYKSNSSVAQQMILKYEKKNISYIGEWHTHAEDFPSASSDDNDAMKKLLSNSSIGVNGLILLIVGRSRTPRGFQVSLYNEKIISTWELTNTTDLS